MRLPKDWQESDLLSMIESRQEESLTLEFKNAGALQVTGEKKVDISKDVSAFVNSAGGAIVYGMDESTEEPHYAFALSPVDPNSISKEWLEQVINARIQPRISGIFINPIELKIGAPGRFAYVVVIPEGSTAHQASDKRYYKRFNFESVPMEDYEVKQTMIRASRPAYDLRVVLSPISELTAPSVSLSCKAIIENVSEIVGHDLSVVLFAPVEMTGSEDGRSYDYSGQRYGRRVGNYIESSSKQGPSVGSAQPLVPYHFNFVKGLTMAGNPTPPEFFTLVVRVFDQFGLALRGEFKVRWPALDAVPVGFIHAAKRVPSTRLL